VSPQNLVGRLCWGSGESDIALAWGAGLDWLIWQSLPGASVWLGAVVVMASGLFLLRHENRLAKTEVQAGRDRP